MKTTKTQFNVGDVVMLPSGGPPMTVEYVHDTGDIGLIWFGDAFAARRVTIKANALIKSPLKEHI